MSGPAEYYTAEQTQQLINEAIQNALQNQAHEHEQASAGSVSASQVQAIVDEALARQADAHNAQIEALAQSLRGSVLTFIPDHAAGQGTQIEPTWSQYEQGQAKQRAEAEAAA